MAQATSIYHEGSRTLQKRFDTVRLADRIEEALVHDSIDDGLKGYLESLDFFFLATADAEGRPTCSYKGGDPGLLKVVDPKTLAFPNYDGNGMYLSMGNLRQNPNVGLLFLDLERANRMRIQGEATITEDDPLAKEWPECQFVVRVHVREVFPNCPRYIHRFERVASSPFVPREGCETPVPGWKKAPWAKDVLAKKDPARDPKRAVR